MNRTALIIVAIAAMTAGSALAQAGATRFGEGTHAFAPC